MVPFGPLQKGKQDSEDCQIQKSKQADSVTLCDFFGTKGTRSRGRPGAPHPVILRFCLRPFLFVVTWRALTDWLTCRKHDSCKLSRPMSGDHDSVYFTAFRAFRRPRPRPQRRWLCQTDLPLEVEFVFGMSKIRRLIKDDQGPKQNVLSALFTVHFFRAREQISTGCSFYAHPYCVWAAGCKM